MHCADTKFRLINPLHHSHSVTETATVARIRLMLGEHTALALGVLVAADVLDTVLKPAHAYQLGTYVILCSRKLEKKGDDGYKRTEDIL